jgi:hypothetical protein
VLEDSFGIAKGPYLDSREVALASDAPAPDTGSATSAGMFSNFSPKGLQSPLFFPRR